MATLAQLGVTASVEDRATGPLNAISAAADKTGAAVEQMDTRVGRTNRTFQDLAARIEPVERGVAAVERATRGLNAAMEQAERQARAEGVAQDRLAAVIAAGAAAKEQAALKAVRGLTAEQQAAALTRAGYAQLAMQVQATSQAQANLGTVGASRIQDFAAANDNAAKSGLNLRSVLGQAGFQIQDFATQISMGGNALQAFGVQGAQLAGIFGPTGAIIGAGLVVATLAAQLLLGRSAADQFADAMKRQADSLKLATDDAQRWRDGLKNEATQVRELTEYYAQLSTARVSQEQRQLAVDRASLVQQAGSLRNDATGSMTGVARELQAQMAMAEVARNQLGASLAGSPASLLSEDDLARMRNAVAIIGQFAERGDVSREALAQMTAALATLGEGSVAVGQLLARPLAAIDALTPKARELEVAQENVAIRARAMGQEMHGAADEASRLNRALQELSKREGDTFRDIDAQIGNLDREIAAARGGAERLAQVRAANRREDTFRREIEEERKAIEGLGITGQEASQRLDAFGEQLRGRLDTQGARQDELRRLEDGLRRTGGAARDTAASFGELRRASSGILVANPSDELAIRSILAATNNSTLDPDRFRNATQEAERALQGARTETERYAETLAKLRPLLDGNADSQALYNRAAAAADPAVVAARKAADELPRQAQQAANQMESTFSGAFTRAFESGSDAGKSFLESVTKGVKSLAATIASQLVFRMAVVPVVNSVGGMVGLGSNLLSSPNTSIGGVNLGGLFGGSSAAVTTPASGSGLIGQAGTASSGQTIMSGLRGFNPGDYISGNTAINTGWGAADGFLNTPISGGAGSATGSGFYSGTAMAGEAGNFAGGGGNAIGGSAASGLTYGGAALGAAGVLGGAYGIYSGIQKGGVGGYTGAAGGAATAGLSAAALAGLSVPVYGWIAAALLTIAGALLPGAKPSGKGQEFRVDLLSGDTEKNGLTGDRYSGQNASQAESAARSISALSGQLSTALGGARIPGEAAVGVTSSRGDGPGQLYLEVSGRKAQFTNDEEGAKQLADKAAAFLLEAFRESVSGDFVGILNGSPTVEKLQENLTWYDQVYKRFGQSAEAASAFQQQLDQVTATFQTNIDKASELALATDVISTARQKEIDKLIAQRDLNLRVFDVNLGVRQARAQGNTSSDLELQASLMGFDIQAAQEMEQAKASLEALGVSASYVADRMVLLESVQAAERLKIQQDYADQANEIARQQAEAAEATAKAAAEAQRQAQQQAAGAALNVVTGLRDYVQGLSTSEASVGTVLDRFNASGREFNATFGAARVGDANSLSRVQGAAETYRLLAREIYGGGQGYADAVQLIADRLGTIGELGAETLTQSFLRENARENTDRIVDALADLRAENARLRTDINQLLSMPRAA